MECKMTSILYVEDNEDNIYMLSKRLKKKGFDITIAKDGEEGLKAARELETRPYSNGFESSIVRWLGGNKNIKV